MSCTSRRSLGWLINLLMARRVQWSWPAHQLCTPVLAQIDEDDGQSGASTEGEQTAIFVNEARRGIKVGRSGLGKIDLAHGGK